MTSLPGDTRQPNFGELVLAVSRRRIRPSTWLVGVLGVGLIATGGGMPTVASAVAVPLASSAAAALPSADETESSGTDLSPAMVEAQASGERVEDTTQRDEFTRVYANPDGTWTSETASSPESVQDESGTWHYVDPTLVEDGDRLAPRYGLSDVSISAGGDKAFVTMSEEGHDLAWKWPTVLPEPVVDGASATYEGVAAGGVGDLVVTATDGGFSYNVVLHEEPTEPVQVAVPVITDGGVLEQTQDGGLAVSTNDGDAIVAAPEPVMFDATTDDVGDPTNVVTVGAEVAQPATGASTLTLLPDENFLHDPDTVYPVTVDPTFTTYSADAWVQNPDYPNGQTSSPELRVGTYDGGTHTARTFMHFDGATDQWRDMDIESATLVMRNFDALTCAGSAIRASRITSSWGGNATLAWTNQPSVSASDFAEVSGAKGYSSSCPAGDTSWNIKEMAQAWANGTPNEGIRLAAVEPTKNSSWRRYRSANIDPPGSSLRPHLNVTYRNPPTRVGVTPAAWYQPATGAAMAYTSTVTPSLKAQAADADTTRLHFEVLWGGDVVATCESSTVSPTVGTLCPVSPALAYNSTFTWRVKAKYGTAWAGGSLDAEAGWSDSGYLRVAATTPAAPQINCGGGYPNGGSGIALPSTPLTCKISAAASSYSAPAYIRWSVDGGPQTRTAITQSTDPAIASTFVGLSNNVGSHSIVATAESPSGLISAASNYSIGFVQPTTPLTPPTTPAPDSSGGSGGDFTALTSPSLAFDSKTAGPLAPGVDRRIPVSLPGVADGDIDRVSVFVQAVDWTGAGSLTVYEPDTSAPATPTLSLSGSAPSPRALGATVEVPVSLSTPGSIMVRLTAPSARVLIHVQGWYAWPSDDGDDDEHGNEGGTDIQVLPSGHDLSYEQSAGSGSGSGGQTLLPDDGSPSMVSVEPEEVDEDSNCGVNDAGETLCLEDVVGEDVPIDSSDPFFSSSEESSQQSSGQGQGAQTLQAPTANTALCWPLVVKSGQWYTTRYSGCMVKTFTAEWRTCLQCLPTVATYQFRYSAALGKTNLKVTTKQQIIFKSCVGTGCVRMLSFGMTSTCDDGCSGSHTVQSGALGPEKTVGTTATWSYSIPIDYPNSQKTLTVDGYISRPSGFTPATMQLHGSPYIRCDNYTYFSQSAGCVFRRAVTKWTTLSVGDPYVDEAAVHIRDAQREYPYGVDEDHALTRGSLPDRRLHRRTACRGWDRTLGSCDEWPMAATSQGCGDGVYCSVRGINLNDNRNAGSRFNGFMRRMRIVRESGDKFLVVIGD
jgi:hypothetical protein